MKYALSGNSFIYCFLIFSIGEFSEGIVTSSLTSDENEGHFEDRASSANEIIWAGTSESNYQVSYFIESQMSSSDGTRSSLSLFHSEVKKIFLSHRGYPENEHETMQFSSKKLFSVMKNKNKNVMFSSEFNSSRTSGVTTESEDLDVTPCPPAHLFLSRDQVRLLEENVRSQILLKSKATLESKTTRLYSSPQEFLIEDQHSIKMGISAQAQDCFPRQNAIQNQGFYKAQFTSQAQQFVNNQDSMNSQPDIKARHFALPQELMRTPFSSNTQDAFQTQETDRHRHLAKVPHSVQTQDSVKGLESNKKQFNEAQYSVRFEDSNRIKYAIQRRNTIFKNARCLVLTLSPHSMAKLMPQRKRVKPKGQKQVAWKCKQHTVGGSVPLSPTIKRQKKRRKALHSERKSSPKITSEKSEKTPTSQVFQIKECYTSRHSKSKCKYNTKRRELHQRRGLSDTALHLTDAPKHVPPYIKKYSRKKRVTIMTGLTGCRPFLLMQSKSPDAEKVNYTGSTKKRGPSGRTKNLKLCERDNEGLKNVSQTTLPQPGQCFTINTCQLKTPCSSLIETNWKNQESLKDSIARARETDIAEFHGPNSKKRLDLYIRKHETPLEEAISEPLQQSVSSPQMEWKGRMRTWEALKCTEHWHLPLSNGENLPMTTPEMPRCFPKVCRQKQKDFPEVVLKSSEGNLHISQGTQKHESTEQFAGVENQERIEDVIVKGKKPLTLTITECGALSASEELECNTSSNTKNVQDKRTSDAFPDTATTPLSAPPDREVRSGLKVRADTSRIGLYHPLGKQEKSPEEKKIWNAEHLEKRCIFKKPQDRDREEEEETSQEAFPQLTQDFRFSLQLKQTFKYDKCEIEKSSLGSRKTQNEQQEAQSHILSTETNLGTSPCPTVGPFQVEKMKQSTDGPTDRETEDPQNPLRVSENLPGSIVAQGSFTVHILPVSYFKRQEVRNQLPRTKRALSSRRVNMKVRKPVTLLMPYIYGRGNPSHRKILRGCFKIIIKQMMQGNTVADVLLNAFYPHVTVLPCIRVPSILNAENHRHIKPKQEKSQVAREEKCSDSITNGSNYGNTMEAQLQDEVGGDKAAQAQGVLPESWDPRQGAHPEKGLKTEEEMHQPVIPAEIIMEPIHSPVMASSHAENMKEKLPPRTVLKCTADSESPPLTPEKPLTGDPSSQTRERDASERRHCLVETKNLPATFSETFNCHTPVVTPLKERRNRVRCSRGDCTVQPRSGHMKAIKPSTSQIFKMAGHRNKLDSNFKTKLEKISQASGLVYEFLNALYSATHSGSQGETTGFCQAQVEQGERAGEGRRPCVDFFGRRGAFCDKGQDAEAVEQKTLLEAALQCTQHLWPDGCQAKETQLGTPDPALDRDVPSDADPQKEQAGGGAQQEEPGASGFCVPALCTLKKKRHIKQYSHIKYRILKAKKPSISYMLNIKGGANPNLRKELGCNPTAKMRGVGQGEKVADKMHSFKTITPDINMYSKTEREKDTLGEKRLRSKPVKQVIPSHEGSISSGHTKESSLQGKEEEESEWETVKVIPPHSQHFLPCSGRREELDLHKSESPGSGEILFLTKQDFPPQMRPADPVQVERPKKSHQTQIYTASSKLPLLKSKESLMGQVLTDTVKHVPCDGSQMWELDSHGEEGRAGFKKDLQATVPGSLDVSTPGPPESKRQRKTFTCRALKSKMSGKCVVMKARKAPTSQTFNTPGNGYLKNLSPMTLKSQIIDFLVYIICSGKLGDLTIKKKEELAQELPAMNLDLSRPALPVTKRNKLELRDKKNKMSAKCVTLKAKKALVSQIFSITKCTHLSRKLKCNLKTMIKPGPPGADIILNAVSSATPVSFAMNMYNGKKVETDMPWKTGFSHKQQKQSLGGESTWWADYRDRWARASGGVRDVKGKGGEAALPRFQHLSFNAHNVTEAAFVKSGLEQKNPARKTGPESVTTAQELPQQAPPTQCGSQSVNCSILNSLPSEKLPKRTKTQKGLKDPKILSPEPGKSVSESVIVTAQSDIPSERGPRKKPAASILEEKIRLQKDLQASTLESFDFSMPASSEFITWRNAAQIPEPRTGKAQRASVSEMMNIAGSGALSHGRVQDCLLENMARGIPQGAPDTPTNTFLSPTPALPAIRIHKEVKAKKSTFRKKGSIKQLNQDKGKRLYTYSPNQWATSSSSWAPRRQNEKEGNEVLFKAGLKILIVNGKDQHVLITEQEMKQETQFPENALDSICSLLVIPFQTERLKESIPSQKDMLHKTGEKIPGPKSEKMMFDNLLLDETEYRTTSDGSPARKLDVPSAVSLQLDKKDKKTQKVIKYTVDPSIPPTKAGNAVFGNPCDEHSRRKVGGHTAMTQGELQRDLLTMPVTYVLPKYKRQKRLLQFPEGKDLTRPKYVTLKAKKPVCLQMFNIPEHGNLHGRKEQECNFKPLIKDMQQNKSIANGFSSPTPVSTHNKIGIKVHSTPKPRVKIHNHTYFRDREAWKASVTDTQNRYSNTMRMYVQHEKEEENIQKTLPESVPHYSQNFSFSAHRMKNLGHCKSESKLKSSAVRRTCNAPCTVEKTRQEKHIRETIWETVSRQVMNLLQVETVKNNTHTQKGIKWMVGLKTPSPKAGKSETGSMQCDTLWDRNPGRKSESPISEQKAWNESDLARTVLKPLAFSSLDSFVPQSQSYTEFVGKESMRPKHATLKEKKLLISQLLNGKRSLTGSPEKKCKRCKFKQRTKERRWEESVAEAFICAAKGVGIPLPILMSETYPFSTVARGVLCNRTHHKDLNGLITEEKAGLEEILAATYVGSLDFFMPVVSDSESQINTVHLSEKKIILNPQHLTLKKKEPPVSQIPKLNRQLTIRQRGELGSHFKTKMKGLKQGKHVADTFPKTISSPWDAADIESRFKTETDRVSRSRHVQPPQMGLPAEGPVSGQSLSAPGHAAFSMNEEQEEKTDGEREKTVLNADLQSIHTSMLVPPHTRMDRSPGTWGNHEESSEKRNILNKVKVMEKQKYEQHGLFRTAPRYTQASEFGACRMRESGPAESQAPLINTVCPTGTTPQKTDIDLIDQETNIKVVEHLSPECVSFSKIHLLEIEKQQEEFKTANWETVANPKIHTAKAEKSLTDVSSINTIECEDSSQQRERMELTGLEHLALHDKHPEPCVSGTLWSAPYAHTPVYPKTIKHKAKAETADVKNTMHTKQVKLEAQELPASHLFKTTGYGTRRNTKKLRSNIKSRKEEFKEGKTAADLALNTVCESRCTQSPVKEFMEIKREKDKPRERICIPAQVKLEKSLNRRNRSPLQFSNKSATSRNPKKLKQCVREQKEKRQIVLQDIVLQCRDQVVISQPVKEEDNHIKLVVNLEREAYPDLFPWKRRTSYSRLDNPRIRILTDCKSLIAQRVQEGDADIVPQGREESEKTAISLHAKEQNMFLAELDASQQKTCEEQELLKRESISMTNQGSISYLKTIPPHLENVVKVAEEDMYTNRENIPQLLRREKLKTDILQGSKGQKYLYTNLEIQQNMSAVRKGEVKPNHIPERILDSTSCLRRGPLHAQEAVNTRKKENISIPVSLNENCWGKEESKSTDNQLKANGQKVNLSKKLRAKQVHSSNQNEETILGVISSCILHHLNIEQLKKEGSAQGMSSKFLSQMVEKASNKADFPGDPPPCSMRVNLHTSGRKKYQKESTGKGLPTSVSRSPMAVLKITLPCVGKSQKAAERPKYHTANTEGSGLPIEGKTERLECIPQILPNPNSNPLRDRFQNKMPSRKKSSEEAVSTAECTPHAEGIGSLLTGKEEQQEKCAYEALPKPASHSKTGLREMNTPGQQVKLDTNVMHCEYSTPQAAEPLKGMDVIAEYTQKSKTRQNLLSMEQNKQHLLNPHKNFLEHMFYSPNDPQLLQHVTPQTKKALPEVGSISSRTKGLDLFPKDQPNTVSEDGPEWTVPSIPLRQKKNQNTMLPLGSYSKTIKHLTASFPEGSTSSNEARVIRLLSNSGSHKLRVRRKVGGTAYQRVQAMCLPGIFLHSVSTYMPILPGTKRQEDSIKQGVTKGITYPLRTLKLKESVFSNALNSMDYVIPSSRPVPQWDINEKMVNVKHRKGQPDTVVTNPFEFISPLPHLKLSKETTDGIISNNVKTIKQCMSQRKEDRIKEGSRREIMNPNVILKAKKPSVSRVLNGMELPVLLNTLKQECKAQTGKGESGGELTKFCTFLPPLSHPNLDLRIKVGKGKSGIPRSCLLPPKLQASTNIRKTSSAESMNRDSLSSVIGSKQYLPQKKREVRGHTVNVKDKMDLQHISPKGKKTSIKPTLLGKESQWNNKEREKRMQKEKSDVGIVQRKSHAAIPPSPHVEGGPGVEEEIHIQGITGFCLPSLTLRELADEMGTGKEPTDDILSSIRKAKHLPQQDGDRVPMALEEMRRPQRRAASKAGRPVTAQGLQLNVRDRNNQAQEDERVVIQSKSCASISLPPYSEVETRRKGEAMLIKTRSSFLQLELHESSDTGKKASKKPIYYDMSNSVKKAKEHIMQDKEERVKMAKVTPLKKKESPILWEIQLDSKEQEKKIQKFKGEPSMVPTNTNTCMPAPSHLKWERGIKKTDHVTKITRDSLPELSPQRSDSVKKTNKKCTEGGGTGDTQEAGEDVPQGEEADGKTAAGRAALHPRDKDVKGKNMLPQATPLNPKEGGTGGPEGDRQGEMDPKGKGQGTEDGEGRGEWEAVLPTERPSEFSLAHHESETEGKEDTLKGTGPATSQPWLQTSVDAGQLAEPQAVRDDMKAIQEDEPQEEEERGNTAHMQWVPHPRGTASKAETSPPPPVSSVAEPRALSKKKEAQWSSKKKEQKQGRTGEPDVGLTKTPSAPSPSHDRVDTGTQGDTDLLAVFSPSQLQPTKSAGAGKLRYAESNGNTSPCNRILKANPCAISEDNRRRLHTRHQKMSLEGTDTIKLNSKHKSPEDSSPTRRMETLTVNVLSGKKKPITKLQGMNELECGTSSVTAAEMPWPPILQKYSVEGKDRLLRHFTVKTLETQMKALPRPVIESYVKANIQGRTKPLSKCIHSGVKVRKQQSCVTL